MAEPQVAENEKTLCIHRTASGGAESNKEYIYKSRKWKNVKNVKILICYKNWTVY